MWTKYLSGRPTRTRWVDLQSSFSGCQVRSYSCPCGPKLSQTLIWNTRLKLKTMSHILYNPSSVSSCNMINFSALRSIGLRCMEHLFFLRIVGEVSITSFHISSLIICVNKVLFSPQKPVESIILFKLEKKHHLNFSGEHQRDWLTSLWFAGGRPGLNWDLWHSGQKWSENVPAVKIARPEK